MPTYLHTKTQTHKNPTPPSLTDPHPSARTTTDAHTGQVAGEQEDSIPLS